MSEIKITQLVIRLGENRELSLTLEEARKLKAALDELLVKEVRTEYVPYPTYVPYSPPRYPRWDLYYTTAGKADTNALLLDMAKQYDAERK